MVGGQALQAASCIGLLLSDSMTGLIFWYFSFMLGASCAWGVYMCVVPEYVPEAQRGVASGIMGMANVGGRLSPCRHRHLPHPLTSVGR